ncbi:MAG: YvcK family protein [Candidatus Pacebacteria bacterium]|nr:YvcK family protein [Candidatus Paceibacterota bacterium]
MKARKNHHNGIKAVVMGGGTGTFMVLSSLKHFVSDISAVITMADDGGSTGVLRDELGVLPPGDVRQSLVALSSSSEVMRELFNYRFSTGTFNGHSFGNIFLTALEKVTGSFAKAVVTAGEILHITGQVIPVTTDNVRLCVERGDGSIVQGQKMMISSGFFKGEKTRFFLEPKATINPLAKKAILEADLIILGPGNLHSSLIPILLTDGMSETLKEAKGKKIYITNMMTQPGQTENFSVTDFVDEVEKYAGKDAFDYVVYNDKKPAQELLDTYAKEGEKLVSANKKDFEGKNYKAIGENLVSSKIIPPKEGDKIHRPLIRHDGDKLTRLLMKIYFS